jgi:hypothetical protein
VATIETIQSFAAAGSGCPTSQMRLSTPSLKVIKEPYIDPGIQQMCGCNDFLRGSFSSSGVHSLTDFTALAHRETNVENV